MAKNLFVSYDLDAPGQNYSRVIEAIHGLGEAVAVHRSLFYVKTTLTAKQAEARVWAAVDANDRVIVIEGVDAWWHNALPGAQEFIQQRWNR